MTFYLSIVTPEEKIFEGEVEALFVPGSGGSMEILIHHAPIMTTLRAGLVIFYQNHEKKAYTISTGFLEVHANRAILLADQLDAYCEPANQQGPIL